MKKLLCVFVGFLLSILPILADTFFEPEWSEFCPPKYVNINSNRLFRTPTAKYWIARKEMFDKRIEQCKKFETAKQGQCFAELRQLETDTTKAHNDEIKVNAINRASIWGTW